jgi:hypothetical protein
MKTGRTLVELAQEIERQKDAKKDFSALAPALRIESNGHSVMKLGDSEMEVNEVAHDQIAEKVGIPRKYYDKMRAEAPQLLDSNVNHWFSAPKKNEKGEIQAPEQLLVRTLDNKVRAVLSSKYRPMDNADFAEAALPVLAELDLMIVSCEITDRNLLIKAVDRRIERDIPTGAKMGNGHSIFDTLSPAITLRNSEVGFGALSALTSVWTRQCTNLATFAERSVRKYHVGGRHDATDSVSELFSDKTRLLNDAATWSQVRDVVRAAFERARFDALVDVIEGAVADKIDGDVVKVVEVAAKKFSLLENEKSSVLKHLIQGGDLTRYGLSNAITRAAEDLPDYTRATEFERLGGQIIELPKSEWKTIAAAA